MFGLPLYTAIHVLISLVAIATGFIVLFGLLNASRMGDADRDFPVLHRAHQRHRLPVSDQRPDAGADPGADLDRGAADRGRGALCV